MSDTWWTVVAVAYIVAQSIALNLVYKWIWGSRLKWQYSLFANGCLLFAERRTDWEK